MSSDFYRAMVRCTLCRRWWSAHPSEAATARCACGGETVIVNMEDHLAGLPQKVDTAKELEEIRLQQEHAKAKSKP